jgi:hypothetical protein
LPRISRNLFNEVIVDTQLDDLRDSLPPLEDDPSSEHSLQANAEPSKNISVLGWICTVLGIVAAGVIVSHLLSPYHETSEITNPTKAISLQADLHDQSLQVVPTSADVSNIQGTNDSFPADLEVRLAEMDSRLVRLDSFVEQMAAHLDQQSSLLIDLQTGLAEQDEVVAAIEESHQELRKTLLQQTQARNQVQAKPPVKKTPTATFDLRISSVRHLGRSTGVMVRSSDHAQFLAVGQEVNGWRLVSADAQRLHAEFIHTSGQRHEVQL